MFWRAGGPIAGAMLFENEVVRGGECPPNSPTSSDAREGLARQLRLYGWYLMSLYRLNCTSKPSGWNVAVAKADSSTLGGLGRPFKNWGSGSHSKRNGPWRVIKWARYRVYDLITLSTSSNWEGLSILALFVAQLKKRLFVPLLCHFRLSLACSALLAMYWAFI